MNFKFIKLTCCDDTVIYVGVHLLSYFKEVRKGHTSIQFADTEDYEDVKETAEQIIALINGAA